ncbi:MAG: 23S rRNA (guanosine(2251)-2'-O)-methyltransferase RlmB [Mycoplasmataceae bacterium]|nr:23S rRNA (guanosine(2251)-2'-O)-methyltransferase RlmB [Mycoplasmataceae bacterium]
MVGYGKKVLFDNLTNPDLLSVDINASNPLIKVLIKNKIKYTIRDSKWFNRFDPQLNHQGVVVNFKSKTALSLDDYLKQNLKTDLILIIDSIEDPQNFGAIMRTCDALGVKAIIYKKDHQVQINDFVNKASMGACNYLHLFKVANLANTLPALKANNYWIYSSALNDQAKAYNKITYADKVVLIVGNEKSGVSARLLSLSDTIIKIPMVGHVQSLNVSVATGILLAEIIKH